MRGVRARFSSVFGVFFVFIPHGNETVSAVGRKPPVARGGADIATAAA